MPGEPTREQIRDWWEEHVATERHVELVATDAVRGATGVLYNMIDAVTEWNERDAVAGITARLDKRWDDLHKARGDLIVAMRADIGPKQ